MSSPAHGSPGWAAEREFALLMLLTDGNRKAAQQLWLRKVRIHREAPPGAGASAPKAATAKPRPAPARARAVPKLETAAQLARRERSQIRLRHKHLASKIWASVRVASRLLAWCSRSRLVKGSFDMWETQGDFVERIALVERAASLGTRDEAALAPRGSGPIYRLPILVGRLIVQQGPSSRARIGQRPGPRQPRRPPALVAPPPATQLAALAPPSQQPPLALAAAARATLDPSELQDFRGSKRDALARTPPRAESRKKTRGTGALQAALAAAAPAAAAPQPPTATTPLPAWFAKNPASGGAVFSH
jgi:hypothetical protein